MPPVVFLNINKKLTNLVTRLDKFSKIINFNCQLNYLETGVSVMKNFLQVENF